MVAVVLAIILQELQQVQPIAVLEVDQVIPHALLNRLAEVEQEIHLQQIQLKELLVEMVEEMQLDILAVAVVEQLLQEQLEVIQQNKQAQEELEQQLQFQQRQQLMLVAAVLVVIIKGQAL